MWIVAAQVSVTSQVSGQTRLLCIRYPQPANAEPKWACKFSSFFVQNFVGTTLTLYEKCRRFVQRTTTLHKQRHHFERTTSTLWRTPLSVQKSDEKLSVGQRGRPVNKCKLSESRPQNQYPATQEQRDGYLKEHIARSITGILSKLHAGTLRKYEVNYLYFKVVRI